MPIGGSSIYSIIHNAASADTTNFVYGEIYVGTAGGTATINGTPLALSPSSSIELLIRTISGVTGDVYLLGDKRNVISGSSVLGGGQNT